MSLAVCFSECCSIQKALWLGYRAYLGGFEVCLAFVLHVLPRSIVRMCSGAITRIESRRVSLGRCFVPWMRGCVRYVILNDILPGTCYFLDTPCKSQTQMEHTCEGACEHVRVDAGTGMVQGHIRHLSCIAPIIPPVTGTVTVIVTPCGMHSNCNCNYNYRFDMMRFRFDSSER